MIYVLPGMGADSTMYRDDWRTLEQCAFLHWPAFAGEKSLHAIAEKIVNEAGIADGSTVVGSSLGGMVACEIARIRKLRGLILIGSAIRNAEISGILATLHPLADYAPLEFLLKAAGSLPHELTEMFSRGQADFIRGACRAIFKWNGLDESLITPRGIHGRWDRVIYPPAKVDKLLDGGHLIAWTHPKECVEFVRAGVSDEKSTRRI